MLAPIISNEFDASIRRIKALLPVSDVDVVVKPGKSVLPEIGLIGHCPSSEVVYITIDPEHPDLLNNFSEEFLGTLGHELHHCVRNKSTGYGEELGEALVSEGLACHFETELRQDTKPIYINDVPLENIVELLRLAKRELNNKEYDHNAWFFGSREKAIPRYFGYAFGYYLVSRYIKKTGVPASQLFDKHADEVLTVGLATTRK